MWWAGTVFDAQGAAVAGNFEILTEEGWDDVHIKVRGPKPQEVMYYETEGEEEGNFEFDAAMSGDQSICLTNSHSSDTRPIGFAFREEAQELLTGADLAGMAATEENVGEMVTVANDLTQGLDMLRDHQEYMRMREEQHRATVAKTNSKVLWWTCGEAFILVAMACWQILYIRTFFEVKRYV